MPNVLLLDLGASRIKYAVWNGEDHLAIEGDRLTPAPVVNTGGKYEVDPEEYWKILSELCIIHNIDSVVICSEMHGFIVEYSRGYSNYMSWQDQRGKDLVPTFAMFDPLFREITGMKFKAGLPITNLIPIIASRNIANKSDVEHVYTLVDWLLVRGGWHRPKINQTLACSTGVHYIMAPNYYSPATDDPYEKLGVISINDKNIDVYGGFGDLQTAAYGAGFPEKGEFLINLGTGSQVLSTHISPHEEWRYGIDGKKYGAVTHIPCGRALAAFQKVFPTLYDDMKEFSVDDVMKSTLNVDLAVYESARYHDFSNGSIYNITEDNFTQKNITASIIRCWLAEYFQIVMGTFEGDAPEKIIVSGKMGKIPLVKDVLHYATGMEIITQEAYTDDTILGLFKIAKEIYEKPLATEDKNE